MEQRNELTGCTRKKKKWLLPVAVAGSVIVLLAVTYFILLVVMAKKEIGYSTGRYMEGNDGVHMAEYDGCATVLSNRTDKDLFKNLDTGDEILFFHGGVQESYPAKTGVYAVVKLKDGGVEDISEKTLHDMAGLGWLANKVYVEVITEDEFPDWGLTLSVRDVTPSGLTLVCTREGGNPTGEIEFGDEYHLCRLEGETWEDVPTVISNYGFNSMAYWVYEEKDTEFEIDWEWLYGELPPGTYRLVKSFMDFREAGDYDTARYWVEFTIAE